MPRQKQVKSFIKKNLPLVVKADGLAAGKGVTICSTENQILKISEEIFKENLNHEKSCTRRISYWRGSELFCYC